MEHDGEGTDRAGTSGVEGSDELSGLAEQRGISRDVLTAAGIRLEHRGRYSGWWRIPYPHRTGEHKRRYRNPDPTAGQKYADLDGAKFHLFNPQLLGPGEEEIWFCEGEFDTLALIDQGLNAIGIHGVSNVPDEDKESEGRFRMSWLLLFQDTQCFVMFDNDDAGKQAGRKLARALNGTMFDSWDDAYGDANDWHRSDPAGLRGAIDRVRRRVYSSGRLG